MDIGITYFTSGIFKKEFKECPDNFIIEIIGSYYNDKIAYRAEQSEIKLRFNDEMCVNNSCYGVASKIHNKNTPEHNHKRMCLGLLPNSDGITIVPPNPPPTKKSSYVYRKKYRKLGILEIGRKEQDSKRQTK